jgi:TusA-related sulfurtransferase
MHEANDLQRLSVSAFLADERGKACPAPIIALARALRAHEWVELWADDPAASADVRAFTEASGHTLHGLEVDGWCRALVRRRSQADPNGVHEPRGHGGSAPGR